MLPIITLVDTPGAYPGIDAEERNQSEAIARNLYEMAQLKTPIISLVIGEGGSGGALAIGVSDKFLMLEYSTYSVITPEGCAAILWKDPEKAEDAANVLGLTSHKLKKLQIVDDIIEEPLGGAHRDTNLLYKNVQNKLFDVLTELRAYNLDDLVLARNKKLLNIGK